VTVLDEASGPLAPRPQVVAAAVKGSRAGAAAASFLAFVTSPEARKIWADFGFGPP
jgi:ABC-type molybdate transport system substrate-binding protein